MKALLAATFTLLLLCAASPTSLTAQNQAPANAPNEASSNPRFWQATFVNGGHYLVRLDRITSASKHEYIGNGAARVVEVTIGSDTSVVARFYWLEAVAKDTPIAAGNIIVNRAEQLAKGVGSSVSPTLGKLNVIKDYPTTTHTHTVEYALQTPEALNSLYSSLLNAIDSGRGRTWREPAQ